MKLRYGQVAMKILRYGPVGETRAESPATGPASLNKYKKEGPEPLPFIPLPFLHNNHHNLAQDDLIDKTHFRNRGQSHSAPKTGHSFILSSPFWE